MTSVLMWSSSNLQRKQFPITRSNRTSYFLHITYGGSVEGLNYTCMHNTSWRCWEQPSSFCNWYFNSCLLKLNLCPDVTEIWALTWKKEGSHQLTPWCCSRASEHYSVSASEWEQTSTQYTYLTLQFLGISRATQYTYLTLEFLGTNGHNVHTWLYSSWK